MKQSRTRRRNQLSAERLEARIALTAGNLLWTDTSQMTLSFAPDGTEIGDEANVMHRAFNHQFGNRWQNQVLRAFQTWAQTTTANIGFVTERMTLGEHIQPVDPVDEAPDDSPQAAMVGFPFGTPGPRTDDPRFGDIRIGARPLSENVYAIAVAHDKITSGTWTGDVIFNSDKKYETLEEFYAVALHEAGHVFGLEHNDQRNSVMFESGKPRNTELARVDRRNIQFMHGTREPDQYESMFGNDHLDTATPIELPRTESLTSGRIPAILYANLHQSTDNDFYVLPSFPEYEGRTTLRLQTAGISLLAAEISLYDANGIWMGTKHMTGLRGGTIDMDVRSNTPSPARYLQISAARPADRLFGVGSYSLSVTYDDTLVVKNSDIASVMVERYRNIVQNEIQKLFDPVDKNLNADLPGDGQPASAIDIERRPGFELFSYYEAVGSISDRHDSDVYRVLPPKTPDNQSVFMQSNIRSLQNGKLIPELMVIDSDRQIVESTILVNANGEFVLQTEIKSHGIDGQIRPLFIRAQVADVHDSFDHGNYRLGVYFTNDPVEVEEVARGKVDSANPSGHHLYVGQSQLFHFTLESSDFFQDATRKAHQGIAANFLKEDGTLVHQVITTLGTIRSSHSVLLPAGAYFVHVFPLSFQDSRFQTQRYRLSSIQESDPFASDDDDPTEHPFACPDEEDLFCYPGGIISEDPDLWDDFTGSLPPIPDLELHELIDLLVGVWWEWYWGLSTNNLPPQAEPDQYDTIPNTDLEVAEPFGVLENDFDEDDDPIFSYLFSQVGFGTIELALDGSFVYSPNLNFVGTDYFEYVTYDFRYQTPPTRVTLSVISSGIGIGDLNDDGEVNPADVNLLALHIRDTQDPVFDLNEDDDVNFGDLDYLIHELIGTYFGDANLDGRFEPADLILIFQAGQYEDAIVNNSIWETGDWNGDGEFDSGDLIVAFQDGGYGAAAVAQAVVIDLTFDDFDNRKMGRHGKRQIR